MIPRAAAKSFASFALPAAATPRFPQAVRRSQPELGILTLQRIQPRGQRSDQGHELVIRRSLALSLIHPKLIS